jgi:dihydroflavonol-4-reductase
VSRAFVTGGSGFIGGALIERLVADRTEVVALARSADAAAAVERRGATAVRGDLSDAGRLAAAMRGCGVVFHVAGVNEMCPRNELAMFRANVTGTRNVVAAAAAAGTGRVVYTSSAVTIGEAVGTMATEDTPHRGRYLSTYERSKHEAELVALTAADHHDVEVVAVNPSSVQGPGRVGGSARIFLYALRSERPWLFETTLSIVDLADTVEAHLLAARHGVAGRRYLISGTAIRVSEAIRLLAEVAGIERHPRMIPRGVVRSIGLPVAYLLRYLPLQTRICPDLFRVLLHGHTYDGSRAVDELGLDYTPIETTLRTTIGWYRSEGLLEA